MPTHYLSCEEINARILLHALPQIGAKRFYQLVTYFHSAQKALANQHAWSAAGLPRTFKSIDYAAVQRQLEQTQHWLENALHHVLFWDDPLYPALLKELPDAPPVLFVRGKISCLEKPQLAMVGSRHASKPGLDTAYQFAKILANAGFVVTSGLALGIDGAAHAGALAGNGLTVAVLGSGFNHLYPVSHKKLAETIVESDGALVSEFPLAAAPQASNFPRRNRIISGLSLGVLVVEATLSSGSLITAKLAAEQGREVMAIPGSIHHPAAKGCHQLIREGATLVESIEHIMEVLQGWKHGYNPVEEVETSQTHSTHPIINLLRAMPQTSEAIAVQLAIPFDKVLIALTELELEGRVSHEAGLWYASS